MIVTILIGVAVAVGLSYLTLIFPLVGKDPLSNHWVPFVY